MGSGWQTLPQLPQLLLSVLVFTQEPKQTVPEHEPPRQHAPAAQTVPQLPQLLLSVCVFTQVGKPDTVHTVGAEAGQEQL